MRFRNEYKFLSNMYTGDPIIMTIGRRPYTFTCVEAAFQAHKDPSRADEFENIDGYAAKKLGRQVNLRPDWEQVKDDIMLECLRQKFSTAYMQKKLIAVDEPIVEDNTWNDTYWGKCNGVGQNRLGQLLEQVKHEVCTY